MLFWNYFRLFHSGPPRSFHRGDNPNSLKKGYASAFLLGVNNELNTGVLPPKLRIRLMFRILVSWWPG